MKKCEQCGGSKRMKPFTFEAEIDGVVVEVPATSTLPTCAECGVDLLFSEVRKFEQQAAAGVLSAVEKPTGAMLRYARKALGLKQTELAEALGHAGETVSRWETGQAAISRADHLALITLLNTAITPPAKLDDSGVLRLPSHAA